MSMAGLVSKFPSFEILHSVLKLLSQFCHFIGFLFTSSSFATLNSTLRKFLNPQKANSSPHHQNKTSDNKSHRLFYGVDDVTILEPFDSKIVPQKTNPDNIYHRIVSVMKQSTQEYYNMRIVLGLKVA